MSEDLLKEKTAVCEEVARQMVIGANKMFGTDYSIAITGYAGPGGGTDENPVGTVWIAFGSNDNIVTRKVFHDMGRDENTTLAAEEAMAMLRDFLKDEIEKNEKA